MPYSRRLFKVNECFVNDSLHFRKMDQLEGPGWFVGCYQSTLGSRLIRCSETVRPDLAR